jgi:hypothetical protein
MKVASKMSFFMEDVHMFFLNLRKNIGCGLQGPRNTTAPAAAASAYHNM